MFDFEQELKNLPSNPGVYIMHDKDDKIIYVGKAKVLKNRVRQYFQKNSNHTPKVIAMVSNIAYFEYIVTDSEREALALECNLIKKHRPKYNILLKDDKHYPYIKVTLNEQYPKIMMTRKLLKDGAKYYGPYMGKGTIRNTLDIVQKLFKPPMCHRRFPDDIKKGRPCLNYHINKCFAPCTGNISQKEYHDTFEKICKFLEGHHGELINELTDEMKKASQELKFEKAAQLRDKINSINEIEDRQKIINTDHQSDKDVIALAKNDNIAFCEMFFVRGGKVLGRESYKIDNSSNASDSEIMTDFVKQFYQSASFIPEEILTEFEIDDIELISEWLSEKKGKKVTVAKPKIGEKAKLVRMVKMNADVALSNYVIRQLKEKEKNSVLEDMQKRLGLDNLPYRIEAYDISNIQGSDNVGAMAVFENGKPAKRKYRIFKIKSFEGADDYSSMREVIYRRMRHALEEQEQIEAGKMNRYDAKFLPLPDLILLDGGKGHLGVITELMDMIDDDTPVFGMVKNDKHRTRGLIGIEGEVELSPTSAVFKLITHIQDEVHDAAIGYHHKLHERIDSELDKISGIGEKRRNKLLTKFGSIDKIKEADLSELEKVVDKKTAQSIFDYFRSNDV